MIYGSQRAFMRVELTEEELRLIDPEAYQRKISPWDSRATGLSEARGLDSQWNWRLDHYRGEEGGALNE